MTWRLTTAGAAVRLDAAPVIRAAGAALLFAMLFVPTAYQPLKVGLLVTLLAAVTLRTWRTRRLALHPDIVVLALGYMALGLATVTWGQLRDAPGALRMSTVFVVWPLVYTFLASGFDDDMIEVVGAVLVAAAFAVPLYSLSYVLWAAGRLPDALYVPLDQGQAVGFYAGYIEFNLYSIASLLFLTPYLVALIAIPPEHPRWWTRAPLLWSALALNVLTVLLTGRRALLLVVGLTPCFVALTLWMVPAPRRTAVVRRGLRVIAVGALLGIVGMIALSALSQANLGGIWRMFVSGFQFQTDQIASLRNEQFQDLVRGWLGAPLFGVGQGMPAPTVVRSFEMPWAYELSYVALLYHTGIVGVAAYAFGLVWVVANAGRLVRAGVPAAELLLPVLVGSAAFLVANATNPYLLKWDYLWTIFLPVALVNLGEQQVTRLGAGPHHRAAG